MDYAYARVSAFDQNFDRQFDSFLAQGISPRNIYSDKKSGKDFERTNYKRLIRKLRQGDLLIIKSIDRLGRNYEMIMEEWRKITKIIGADILVLDMPLLDTRDWNKSLTSKFVSDLVLQILSYVAETERENIKARQREGIAAAKRRGVKFGRPPVPVPHNFEEIVFLYKRKQISLAQALNDTGLKQSTFYLLMHALQKSSLP